ncbi:MAG: hypothetical protein IT379_41385 [Deltaproteobacteria bacterium]|nr:hypothetical protein [Deltaproteobacteria bacterium]
MSDGRKVVPIGERRRKRVPPTDGPGATPAFATAMTDLGNAERFAAQNGRDVRYCHGWLAWDRTRWRRDVDDEIHRRAHATARSIYAEAAQAEDEDRRNALARHAVRSESDASIRHLLARAQHLTGIVVRPEALDADPFLLNCENGTLDLRTGELRPHRREDLITKIAPVVFDPAVDVSEWQAFLLDRLGSHQIVAFLQRAVGYSLTADTRHDVLFLVLGPGGSGKSTFVEAVRAALGEYGRSADFESFLRERNPTPGRARPDLVALVGARMVTSVETDRGKKLAEGLIKSLSGSDTKAVRDVYRKTFEFRPTFKLWLVCNDAPRANADDEGIWRRILRVPFDRAISREAQDPALRAAWLTDPRKRSAILNWAVGGCLAWQATGDLGVPDAVLRATEELRAEMDPWAEFFFDECAFGPQARVGRKALRDAAATWAQSRGMQPPRPKELAAALRRAAKRAGVDAKDTPVKEGARVMNGWAGVSLQRRSEQSSDAA